MSTTDIYVTIAGMFIVSYLPRMMPPFLFAKRPLPYWLSVWLKYIPTAVFGALVFSEIFSRPGGTFDFSLGNISLWASLLVTAVSVWTKSLGAAIVSGLLSYWLLQNYF